MTPLDFETARDGGGDSWKRSDPDAATIARMHYDEWCVRLADADESHVVTLRHERSSYVGECDCDGFKFHDGPCAHLCTLRKAEFIDASDVRGERVRLADDTDAADHHVERAVADGGTEVRR